MRGDRARLDRQQERVRLAARRLRLAEAEALAALDVLRAELALSTDTVEGYGLAPHEAAMLAGLNEDRAGRMVGAHRSQVRAARDADGALARRARAG